MSSKTRQRLSPGNLVEPRFKKEGPKVFNYYPYVYGQYFFMTDDMVGMYIKTTRGGVNARPGEDYDIVLFEDRLVQVSYEEDPADDFGAYVSLVKRYEEL